MLRGVRNDRRWHNRKAFIGKSLVRDRILTSRSNIIHNYQLNRLRPVFQTGIQIPLYVPKTNASDCQKLHPNRFIVLSSLLVLLAFAIFVPSASSQSSTSQYATYRVAVSDASQSSSFVVNETVTPTTGNLADLALQAISANRNLSYSRVVNITQQFLFPILPSISNQSLTYASNNYSISFSLMKLGTATSSFSGASYTTTKFAFQVSARSGGLNLPAAGNLTTFPSGLIYSASAVVNGTFTIQASLLGTNLPLDPPGQGSMSPTTTVAVAGSLGTAALVGAFALVKHGKKGHPEISNAKDEKPSHWVD